MIIKTLLLQSIAFIVVFYGFILIILKVNPRLEMKSYPYEIVNRVKRQTPEEKRTFKMLAFPVMIILIAGLLVWSIYAYNKSGASYLDLFLHFLILFMSANIFDFLIMDLLIFCAITPHFIVIPGTLGNSGYKNGFFHFKGFLKGILISAVSAAVMGLIVFLVIR